MAQDKTFPIAGRYRPSLDRKLADAGGMLPVYAAADREDPAAALMAVECRRDLPPRAEILAHEFAPLPGLLGPIAHGAAPAASGESWFVICPAPPGPSLAAAGPLAEPVLLDTILPQLARTLADLAGRGITHRGIRPANIFREGGSIVLGEAWAAPPGSGQPTALEPPGLGMCRPEARGAGNPADDVFALGATLLALALGKLPLEGMTDEEIVRRQIEHGSFAALTAGARIGARLAELLRAMLADDPGMRPHPHNLVAAAHGRLPRPPTRPVRRATIPITIGGLASHDARSLAHAMAVRPSDAAGLVRGGEVSRWLRRGLADPATAGAIDEIVRIAGDDGTLIARAVAAIDPQAPLCWRGLALWPDGLGPAVARARAAGGPDIEALRDLVAQEGLAAWSEQRGNDEEATLLRRQARGLAAMVRHGGPAGGMDRVAFHLNPTLPAEGAALAGSAITSLGALLPALERAAGRSELRQQGPIDRALLPFLAEHLPGGVEREAGEMIDATRPHLAALAQLRLVARMETRLLGPPTPRLAEWLAEGATAALGGIASRSRRKRLAAQLLELAPGGRVAPMLVVIDSPQELAADRAGARAAEAERASLLATLAGFEAEARRRPLMARRVGREAAAAGGLLVTAALVLRLLL